MTDAPKRVSLQAQIAEVERELALRANAYPRFVRAKKMRQGEADKHIEYMQAVLRTLKWLAGENVPPDLPQPGDLLAALIHIRKVVSGPQDINMMETIRKVVEDVLTGIPLPKLEGPEA